jgi:hypothetical protein
LQNQTAQAFGTSDCLKTPHFSQIVEYLHFGGLLIPGEGLYLSDMKFIQGQSRDQRVLIPECLDALIGADHEIRLLDLFADSLDIKATFKKR